MADNVLITPASRKIDFFDSSNNVDATIELNSSGDLVITNPGGDISLGDTTADVFIGDGTNNVDIVFEQNGEIRGLTGVTLTLGQTDSTVAVNALSFVINSNTTIRDPDNTDNYMLMYIESGTTNIADSFADTTTAKKYIYFSNPDGSNDPGFIMHETSDSETNEGVLHLVPTDDNGEGDYVSIHGTNDPDVIKLHTSGLIETASSYRLELKSGSSSVYINDSVEITGALTANGGNGSSGQVLKTSGSGIYWSTISTPANTSLSSASWADANNTLTFTRADSSTTDVNISFSEYVNPANTSVSSASWADANNTLTFTRADSSTFNTQISFSEYVNPANTSLSSASWADANNTLTFTRADSSTTDVNISFSEYVNPANTSTSSAAYSNANTTLTLTRADASTFDVSLSTINQLPSTISVENTTGDANANGTNAIAIGANSAALLGNSIAIGVNAHSPTSFNTIAIGPNANAAYSGCLAIGTSALANTFSFAIGQNARATAGLALFGGMALGAGANCIGTYGMAFGQSANSQNNYAQSVGFAATAFGPQSLAIGAFSNAVGGNTVTVGYNANAGVGGAVALGYLANAQIANTVTLGSPVHDVQINRAFYANGGVGTAGQILYSAGSGANAYWADAPSGGGGGASVSTSPPGSPSDGDLWWDSDQGVLRIYYADPDSNQWVDAVPQGTGGGGGGGALGDLSDVSITSVQNNDLLKYNSTAGEWQNTNLGISVAPTVVILTSPLYVAGAASANITNHATYDAPAYFAELRYSNGTVLIQNSSITKDNVNGKLSFTAPSTANTYKLFTKTQDFGDLESEETETTVTVSALPPARYYRLTGSGGSTHTMVQELDYYTGSGQTGSIEPSSAMTSNTAPSPYVATSSGNYNSTSYYPFRSFDNSTGAGWWNLGLSSTYSNWWLQIDLGSNTTILSAKATLNSSYYGGAQTLSIQGSTSGAFAGEEFTLASVSISAGGVININ